MITPLATVQAPARVARFACSGQVPRAIGIAVATISVEGAT